MGFSETFPFSKITFWKKKTLTSLDNYSTSLPSTRITFQNKGKVLDTVQLLDVTIQVLSSKNFTTTRVYTHTSWLPEQSLLQLDRTVAVTKYKLVIPIQGIMILVF